MGRLAHPQPLATATADTPRSTYAAAPANLTIWIELSDLGEFQAAVQPDGAVRMLVRRTGDEHGAETFVRELGGALGSVRDIRQVPGGCGSLAGSRGAVLRIALDAARRMKALETAISRTDRRVH